MHKLFSKLNALMVITLVFSVVVSFQPSLSLANAPRITDREGTSSNWAGYAVQTALRKPLAGAVTDVAGAWTVPGVTTKDNTVTGDTYSSVWIGIDGYSSNTVEQIGTEQDMIDGTPTYSAWYEMYPLAPVDIDSLPGYGTYTIGANDVITASIQFQGNNRFLLTISDKSKNWTFATTQTSPSAKRSSAEWIVEAPWSTGVLPLANFGTASFTSASANGVAINAWGFYDAINMVGGKGKNTVIKASTATYSAWTGNSFTVTWYHN